MYSKEKVVESSLISEFKFYLNTHIKLLGTLLEKYNLSYNDYVILMEIFKNEGVTQYDLSKKLEMSAQRLNQIVKKLEEERLLSKFKEREARGKKSLLIKDKGIEVIEVVNKELDKNVENLLTERDKEDLIIINKMLQRINDDVRQRVEKFPL